MATNVRQIIENINYNEEIKGVKTDFSHIRQILEKAFQSKNALVPEESFIELEFIYNIYLSILTESNPSNKQNYLKELEKNLEIFKIKYKEFAPKEAISKIENIQTWVKVTTALLTTKTYFIVGSYLENEKKQLEAFYQGCISLLDIAESYLSFFTEKGREITKTLAEILINYQPFNDYAKERPPGEFTSTAIGIRNAARAILWEVDRYERKHPESTSLSWEEEEAFIDMLIEDVQEARNNEYLQRDPSEIMSNLWAKILANREEILQLAANYGASNVRVVGLEMLEKNNPSREINFLVTLESGRSLLDQSALMCGLQKLLGYELYVIEEGGLKGEDREHILQEAIPL